MSGDLDLATAASKLIGLYVTESQEDDDGNIALSSPTAFIQKQAFKRNIPGPTPSLRYSEDDEDYDKVNNAAMKIQAAWRENRVIKRHSFCQYGCEATRLVKRYISGQDFEERAASKSHLLLHFDINKTILISDKATGATQADMVNVLLSECAWGRMTIGPKWIANGRLATDRPAKDPQLMTYRNFLDSFMFPYLEGGGAEVQKENKRRKQECHSRQRRFTNEGEPGEMFAGVFKALVKQITQPEPEHHSLFKSGERRILPSFFELLLHLDRIGRSFTLVFRSFGHDISDIVEEMELFATGQHPSYPGVRLAGQGNTDLRLSIPDHVGAFYRTGPKKEDTILALGVTRNVLSADQVTRKLLEDDVQAHGGCIVTGFDDIHQTICSLANMSPLTGGSGDEGVRWIQERKRAPNSAFAIRDYFPYWRRCNERAKAGKLLLVDQADADVVQIFFDDNIFHSNAHIVDARDPHSAAPIPFSIAKNSHLIRVEPINAILDPMYFVRAVSEAELTILRRAEVRQALRPHTVREDEVVNLPTLFRGSAFKGLHANSKSSVARTSLRAKLRWVQALRTVLMMVRLKNALMT